MRAYLCYFTIGIHNHALFNSKLVISYLNQYVVITLFCVNNMDLVSGLGWFNLLPVAMICRSVLKNQSWIDLIPSCWTCDVWSLCLPFDCLESYWTCMLCLNMNHLIKISVLGFHCLRLLLHIWSLYVWCCLMFTHCLKSWIYMPK